MSDTQSDSIHFLNFAKKWFIQYSIQYCFAQDSIQNIIQFKKKSADSIQKIIQFISQGIIDTGRMGKVPKNYLKNVQNRLKKGLFIKNGKYRFKIWFIYSFHDKIQFKGLFNIIFFRIKNSTNHSITFFSRKIQLKNWFRNFNQLENQNIDPPLYQALEAWITPSSKLNSQDEQWELPPYMGLSGSDDICWVLRNQSMPSSHETAFANVM